MIRQQPIEKNIPLPKDIDRWPSRYPIKYMKVGDSFVHIDQDAKNCREFWNRIGGLVRSYAKRYGFKVKIRKVANYSARVWRVE